MLLGIGKGAAGLKVRRPAIERGQVWLRQAPREVQGPQGLDRHEHVPVVDRSRKIPADVGEGLRGARGLGRRAGGQ